MNLTLIVYSTSSQLFNKIHKMEVNWLVLVLVLALSSKGMMRTQISHLACHLVLGMITKRTRKVRSWNKTSHLHQVNNQIPDQKD